MTIEISGGSGLFPAPAPKPAVVQKTVAQKTEKTQPDIAQAASRAAVEEAVQKANEFLKPVSDSIRFSIDEDSGKIIVKVVDMETSQILRQYPSEEMLALAKAMDNLQGVLLKKQV